MAGLQCNKCRGDKVRILQIKVIRHYNCRGEGHVARQCTQPKRQRNADWFKEKILLVQAQESWVFLDEERLHS
ncbi:retrovirus-related pol polyprotein from transposon TNT 1-94 [Tanacetum coccineum]